MLTSKSFLHPLRPWTTRSELLAACKACKDIDKAREIHGAVVAIGQGGDAIVSSALITMYAKCGSLRDACNVFYSIPSTARDIASWTALMLAYTNNGAEEYALRLFTALVVRPDPRSFVVAVKACTKLAAREKTTLSLERGMALHALAAQTGCELQLFVASSLVDMYSKSGSMEDAARIFERMPDRNVVSWTALILGYANNGYGLKSLELLEQMVLVCQPNSQTIVAALKACSSLAAEEQPQSLDGQGSSIKVAALERGLALHSQLIIPLGAENQILVANTLLDLYAKCGSMKDARRVFDSIQASAKTVVSWNALMLGYVHCKNDAAVFDAFGEMQETARLEPDVHTFVILVNACGSCAAMEPGRSVHRVACRRGMLERMECSSFPSSSSSMVNSLIDFYAKCGRLFDAQVLLDSCASRDVVTWSALLDGYARQGNIDHLLATLRHMTEERLQPNCVTFLSLLTACSHAGLIDQCKQLLANIPSRWLSLEHYHVVIDAMGRANQLHQALVMIKTMPFAADAVTWHTLLAAARKWNDGSVASLAFQMLRSIHMTDSRAGSHATSGYVLMASAIPP